MVQRDFMYSAWGRALWLCTCLVLGFGLAGRAFGEASYFVGQTEKLNDISKRILLNNPTGLYRIAFTVYRDVGTFVIPQGSVFAADTLLFTPDKANPGILKLNSSAPLLDVQGCLKPLIFQGMAIEFAHPQATLAAPSSIPNGNLVFRDCFIFADSLGSVSILNWASNINSGLTFERCFLVAKASTGLTKLLINTGSLKITNCNFNLAAVFDATVNGNVDIQHNTFNRIQFKINSENPGVGSTIAHNLFAFRGGRNQTGTNFFHPLVFGEFFDVEPMGFNTNKWFSTWTGLYRTTSTSAFFTATGISIPPVTDRDTTELWNWYLPDTSVGFFSGPQKGNAFNVFPGTRSKRALLYQDSTLVTFDSSPVPRLFLPVKKPGIPPKSQFPFLRFAWADQGGYAFDGFIIDSLKMLSGRANHGAPVLVVRNSDADSFLAQGDPLPQRANNRWFGNTMGAFAKVFFPAYRCLLRQGDTVSVPKTTGLGIPPDDILFQKIDSAGNFVFYVEVNIAYPFSRNDTRYLGLSRSYSTSVKTTDSLQITVHQGFPNLPFLGDSVYWHAVGYKNEGFLRNLSVDNSTYRFVASPTPVDTVIQFFLVEKLSVPKGQKTFSGPGYAINTQSAIGFQLAVDTLARPNPEIFDQISTALSLRIHGRDPKDSVTIFLDSRGSQTAYWQSGNTVDSLRTVTVEAGGKVKVSLPIANDSGMLFLGRRLNIRKSTIFTGLVDGVLISQFFSPASGMLSVKAMSESELGTDPILQNSAFLKGWTLKADKVSAIGFQLADSLPNPVDTSRVKVYARPSGTATWELLPASFSQLNGGKITVSGLAITGARVEVIAIQSLLPLNTLPLLQSKPLGTNTRQFDFTLTSAAAPVGATHFKIELRTIDPLGVDLTDSTLPVALGQTVSLPVSSNRLGIYRIRVYQGNQLIATRSVDLVGLFDSTNIDNLPSRDSLSWHLLATPYSNNKEGLADASWLHILDDPAADTRDSVSRLGIVHATGKDTLMQESGSVRRKVGEALLMASARRFKIKWTAGQVPPLSAIQVASARATGGWQFVSHPFPFPLQPGQIQSSVVNRPTFWNLLRLSKNNYDWDTAYFMSPHAGYAYFFQPGEVLTFDPLKPGTQAKRAAGESVSEFRVDFPGGHKRVEMLPGGRATEEIPWLASPGQGMDVRLGSPRGYLRMAIPADRRLRLPLALYSPVAQKVRWNLTALPKNMTAALLDTATGLAVLANEDSLRLQRGWNHFQLLAGDETDLQRELAQWRWKAERPFAMHWPSILRRKEAWTLQYTWNRTLADNGQSLRLTLMTLDGKIVFDQSRRPTSIGDQVWSLEPINATGTLAMRLRVEGKTPVSWQRKVMVLP